jgi:hypothetical protein
MLFVTAVCNKGSVQYAKTVQSSQRNTYSHFFGHSPGCSQTSTEAAASALNKFGLLVSAPVLVDAAVGMASLRTYDIEHALG